MKKLNQRVLALITLFIIHFSVLYAQDDTVVNKLPIVEPKKEIQNMLDIAFKGENIDSLEKCKNMLILGEIGYGNSNISIVILEMYDKEEVKDFNTFTISDFYGCFYYNNLLIFISHEMAENGLDRFFIKTNDIKEFIELTDADKFPYAVTHSPIVSWDFIYKKNSNWILWSRIPNEDEKPPILFFLNGDLENDIEILNQVLDGELYF